MSIFADVAHKISTYRTHFRIAKPIIEKTDA
jgi:hypothetical protein